MTRQKELMATHRAWAPLGRPIPSTLAPWRLQLHWAAQIVSAAGHTFAEPRADDSHTSLTWDPTGNRLMGEPLRGTPVRAALDVAGLALTVVDGPRGETIASFPLAGRTLHQGYEAMARLLEETSAGGLRGALARRGYDMPEHPVASGAPFAAEARSGYEELARWYGNAAALLEGVRSDHPEASDVRCWPHHFDIAVLLSLPPAGREDGGSIGVGLTPGDTFYSEPYWYVTPSPSGPDPATPSLPGGGRWRDDWFGAVLTGSDLVAVGNRAEAQLHAVTEFVSAAIAAGRAIVAAAHGEEGNR